MTHFTESKGEYGESVEFILFVLFCTVDTFCQHKTHKTKKTDPLLWRSPKMKNKKLVEKHSTPKMFDARSFSNIT